MPKIVLADQDLIDSYAELAREFFREVLDMNFDACLVTDESNLCDFASCGLPDHLAPAESGISALYAAWDAWVIPEISSRYGVAPVKPTIPLVSLFAQIQAQRTQQVH